MQRAPAPAVVDLAPYRCPPVDDVMRYEFEHRVTRPRPDMPGALSRSAVRKWVDELEESEARKSVTGLNLVDAYERCRQAAPTQLTKKPVG